MTSTNYPPGTKTFVPLENNPQVMTSLARTIGLDQSLSFHDVYSLTDADLLAFVPRPALALLVIIPMTPAWRAARAAEDVDRPAYTAAGPNEPVVWFRQTIRHACGLIGLLHCLCNLPSSADSKPLLHPDTLASRLHAAALPLPPTERAQLLYDSAELEAAHQSHAQAGDSIPPEDPEAWDEPLHFVAFVKGSDGHLWELEGCRIGPIDRGALADDEDVLSKRAFELGMGKIMNLTEGENAELRFSAIALAETMD